MAHTMMPTRQGPNPTSHPWARFRFFGVRMVSTPSTRRSVPMISVRRFAPELRMAGAVQKTASLDDGVSVTDQWGRYASHTTPAPRNAPSIWAAMYTGTEAHANLPMDARPMVTAGLRCAPLKVPTAYTATVTPNAQPAVMTIQPEFWPLVLLSTTLATTPSPRMTNSMVPSSSARNGGIGVEWEAAKLPAGQRLVYALWSRPNSSWGRGKGAGR